MLKLIRRASLLCIALAGLAGCGGSSSSGNGLNLYLQLDDGATKYSSGSTIDLGAYSASDLPFVQTLHTFTLVNDSGETVALDGIEFVKGSLDDGQNKLTTTIDCFGDFYLSDTGLLTDADFADGDSAAFDMTFENWSIYVWPREPALWNARKKYAIKVTDSKGSPADFVFEVYGVASC